MTPKEKSKELVLKFAFKGAQHEGEAKKFALIAVDELLISHMQDTTDKQFYFWEEVKSEIEKL